MPTYQICSNPCPLKGIFIVDHGFLFYFCLNCLPSFCHTSASGLKSRLVNDGVQCTQNTHLQVHNFIFTITHRIK